MFVFYPPFYNSAKLCNDILTNVSCRLRRRTTITTKMKYLRNNAACCIPLRPLRYLRENIYASVLNLLYDETPINLSQISLIYADEPQ